MTQTRRRILLGLFVCGVCGVVAIAVIGLYRRVNHLPLELVGEWENDTKAIDAGPGEVRLVLRRNGGGETFYDHQKYHWIDDQLMVRVTGDTAVIWFGVKPDLLELLWIKAPPKREGWPLRIEYSRDHIRAWDPELPDWPGFSFRRVEEK